MLDQVVNPPPEESYPPVVHEPEEPPRPNPLDYDGDYERLLLTRGQDFDLDYTLLVPVIRAHERQQLDLKGCEAGETTFPIDLTNDPENTEKWADCLINDGDGAARLSGEDFIAFFETFLEISLKSEK